MKLNLGCGTDKLDGWINIDSVKEFSPDLVHDITLPLPYKDQSVEEVLAQDLLEHFDKYMRYLVFYEWTRVLRVGGKVTVQVPDFKKILFKYFKFGFNNFIDFIFGETLLCSKIYVSHFGNHKWGYSQKSLKSFIEVFGIQYRSIETKGLNIYYVGEKTKHVNFSDIENVQIYSHANKCGEGKEFVSLGEVKDKIGVFNAGK